MFRLLFVFWLVQVENHFGVLEGVISKGAEVFVCLVESHHVIDQVGHSLWQHLNVRIVAQIRATGRDVCNDPVGRHGNVVPKQDSV